MLVCLFTVYNILNRFPLRIPEYFVITGIPICPESKLNKKCDLRIYAAETQNKRKKLRDIFLIVEQIKIVKIVKNANLQSPV